MRISIVCLFILFAQITLATEMDLASVPMFFKSPADSMDPAIRQGDITALLRYKVGELPKRGDVVIFYSNPDRRIYVKRVIGVPGNTVEIKDEIVYVDNKKIQEPYLHHYTDNERIEYKKTMYSVTLDTMKPMSLIQDKYFVVGDNRYKSTDSRMFGPISLSDIIGKAVVWERLPKNSKIRESILQDLVGVVRKKLPIHYDEITYTDVGFESPGTFILKLEESTKYQTLSDEEVQHIIEGLILKEVCAGPIFKFISDVKYRVEVVNGKRGRQSKFEFSKDACKI